MKRLGPYILGPNNTEENGIYCGDARELAKAIPDESVDFAFVDPPYWVNYDYGTRKDSEMDYIDPGWLTRELERVSRGYFAITPGIGNLYSYPSPTWIISWRKPAATGRNTLGGFNTWEPVLIYGRSERRIWQDEITAPVGREFAGAFNGCPKPIALMTALLDIFTDVGDMVLDFCVGSGTTAAAARKMGRFYLAFEIDPDTCAMARERVRQTQPPLFVPEPEQMELIPRET